MTRKHLLLTAILGAAAFLTASVSAYSAGNTLRVSLPYAGAFSGTPVAAGRYDISWQQHSPTLTVTVAKWGGKVVATVRARMEERSAHFQRNMVVYTARPDGSQFISEIRVGGTNQAIVFTD